MLISTSYLGIKDDKQNNIQKLCRTNTDFIHLDIMDGVFVPNKTEPVDQIKKYLLNTNIKKDIHLMVKDIKTYVDEYKIFNPEYITFHYEATDNPMEIIKYIKDNNIKVGLSIKPKTPLKQIEQYLPFIDLILIMSVEPGKGGQTFILNTKNKIKQLLKYKKEYIFTIEIDGGINNQTIKECKGADIVVIGSYITKVQNYQQQIDKVRCNI